MHDHDRIGRDHLTLTLPPLLGCRAKPTTAWLSPRPVYALPALVLSLLPQLLSATTILNYDVPDLPVTRSAPSDQPADACPPDAVYAAMRTQYFFAPLELRLTGLIQRAPGNRSTMIASVLLATPEAKVALDAFMRASICSVMWVRRFMPFLTVK